MVHPISPVPAPSIPQITVTSMAPRIEPSVPQILESLVGESKTPYTDLESLKAVVVANQVGPEIKRHKVMGHHWNIPVNQQVEKRADGSVVVKGSFTHDWKFDINEPVSYAMTYRNGRLVSEDIKALTSRAIGFQSWKPIDHGNFGGGWRDVAKNLSRAMGAAGYLGLSEEDSKVNLRDAAIKDGVRGSQINNETVVSIDGHDWRFQKVKINVNGVGVMVSGKIYRRHFGATEDVITFEAVMKHGQVGFTKLDVKPSAPNQMFTHRTASINDLYNSRNRELDRAALMPLAKELANRVCSGIFGGMRHHSSIPKHGIKA